MISLILLLSWCTTELVQFIVSVWSWDLVRVWSIRHHLRLHPNACTLLAPKSIPICPKPDHIFYQPNLLIGHRIGILLKNNNLHLYMNEELNFQEETRRKKNGQAWDEIEHYCLRYGVPKWTKNLVFRHLISYNIKFQLQNVLYGLKKTQHIK